MAGIFARFGVGGPKRAKRRARRSGVRGNRSPGASAPPRFNSNCPDYFSGQAHRRFRRWAYSSEFPFTQFPDRSKNVTLCQGCFSVLAVTALAPGLLVVQKIRTLDVSMGSSVIVK
jgi:hypothetical protein